MSHYISLLGSKSKWLPSHNWCHVHVLPKTQTAFSYPWFHERKIAFSTCFIIPCGRAECPYCSCSYLLEFGNLGHNERKRTRQLYCTGGYHEVTWLLKWGTLLLFFKQHDEATAPFSNLNLVWWTANNVLIESVKGCLPCLLVVDHLWKMRIMT